MKNTCREFDEVLTRSLRSKMERGEYRPFEKFLLLKGLVKSSSNLKEDTSFPRYNRVQGIIVFREIIDDCEIYRQHVHYVGKMKSLSKLHRMIQVQY